MPRLGSAKSSTGCATCKIRRVKCDETRPSCRRCTSTGRKCDGYPASLIVKIDSRSYQFPKPQMRVRIFASYTDAQLQAHEFFVQRLVPHLTRVIDGAFWNKHVLQVASLERAVWLAVTAMSQLVRYGQKTYDNDMSNSVISKASALQWYARSVSEMRNIISKQSSWSDLCSMTALIYFCIECLLDNLQNAQSIYQRAVFAVSVACSQASESKSQNETITESMNALFDHLAAAHGLRPASNQNLLLPLSFTFSTMEQARTVLSSQLVCQAHDFVDNVQQERLQQPKNWLPTAESRNKGGEILNNLNGWAAGVAELKQTNPSDVDELAWAVTHLIHLNYAIWVSAMLESSEIAFDKYHDHFAQMLSHAQTAIELGGGNQPLFSFETRVIPSLTFVATRCRHPAIRRKALSLLQIGPQIENTRKASLAISQSRKIIAIEETGTLNAAYMEHRIVSSPPPETNRLVWARVEHDTTGKRMVSWLKFGRWQSDELQNWHIANEVVGLD